MQGIDHVVIRGFKSLADVSIDLRPLNLLIGSNAAGKSNVLAAFRMLNAITESRLETFVGSQGGSPSLLHFGPRQTPRIEFELQSSSDRGINHYRAELTHVAPGRLMFSDESARFEPASGTPVIQAAAQGGHYESRLGEMIAAGDARSSVASYLKYRLDRWRSYHFHDTSDRADLKQPCQLHHDRYLFGDAGNLAAFLRALRETHAWHYQQIRDAVRLAYDRFDDFVLEPSAASHQTVLLTWRERGSSYEFGPHQGSDGTLRFMCLATLLLQPFDHANAPFSMTIDEPELGLHPYAIGLLAEMLQHASAQAQVIVSTQSASLLGAIGDPDAVIVVDRRGGASSLRRLDPEEMAPWLAEYSLGDAWEKGVIAGGGPHS